MNQTDAISRSAVLTVGNVRKVVEYDEAGYDMTYDAVPVEAIEALPALDVAPVVHARWIMNHFGAKCSNCLRLYCMEPSWSEKIKHMPPTWIYCPNCGARMDGDVE